MRYNLARCLLPLPVPLVCEAEERFIPCQRRMWSLSIRLESWGFQKAHPMIHGRMDGCPGEGRAGIKGDRIRWLFHPKKKKTHLEADRIFVWRFQSLSNWCRISAINSSKLLIPCYASETNMQYSFSLDGFQNHFKLHYLLTVNH